MLRAELRGTATRLPELSDFEDETTLLARPAPVPGVYLLFSGDDIVYVGQSGDIEIRLAQHRKEKTKSFTRAQLYHIPDLEARLRVETIYIMYLLPKYNRGINLGLHDGKVWEVKWRRRK